MSHPEGRSMAELRAIVEASNARFDRIGAVWNELTDKEQETLAAEAEAMHRKNEEDDPT